METGITLTEDDLRWLKEGTHSRLYLKMGAHPAVRDGVEGVFFAVWAPRAEAVSVVGEGGEGPSLSRRGESGVWEGFGQGWSQGARYQYRVLTPAGTLKRADPLGFRRETGAGNKSVVWDLDYAWGDQSWMASRGQGLKEPISIYQLDLGSWRRVPEQHNRFLTYRETAPWLAEHVERLGFTHVEFLPLMARSGDGSGGSEVKGYFAPAPEFGEPQDLMFLIEYLHQRGTGVILAWEPAYFPRGDGLARFDGAPLYERARPAPPDNQAFDFGRAEVRSFLLSSAFFWIDCYHADALRIGSVGAMIYPQEGLPDPFGGPENLEAGRFLRLLNERLYGAYPAIQTMAEESSGWVGVSRPVCLGGLGFGFKWDARWRRETLEYLSKDPIERKFSHHQLTDRARYAFAENFILALPHDEVARSRGALLSRLPGDDWQKFAQLRLLLGYQFGLPGKKLLFMGTEFGTWRGWDPGSSLDWHWAEGPMHAGVRQWLANLNRVYRAERALHEGDAEPAGFGWVEAQDADQSTLSWLRFSLASREMILAVCNFTPVPRHNFRVGAPQGGYWGEILNSDAREFGGSGQGNFGGVEANPFAWQGRPHSLVLTLPPFGALFLKLES